MRTPKEDDIITNADESKRLPDENPEPLTGTKKYEADIDRSKTEGSNAAAKKQEGTPEQEGKTTDTPRPEK